MNGKAASSTSSRKCLGWGLYSLLSRSTFLGPLWVSLNIRS